MQKPWGAALGAAALGLTLLTTLGRGQDSDGPKDDDITKPPRWAVMTGTDPGTSKVSAKPTATTIDKLRMLPRPAALPLHGPVPVLFHTTRVGPGETTLWSIRATVISAQMNDDGDYHLVLRGANGKTLVGELPDPTRMTPPSRFGRQMAQSRRLLAARLHPTEKGQTYAVNAQVTGLGYYGRIRPGGDGPPNGIQLHPIIGITFPK